MKNDLAEIPTTATLAFHGLIAEPSEERITEADIYDAQQADDLDCYDEWTIGDEDDHFDPDLRDYEIDERLAWGGMDVPS